jgi:hypothetical protein
MDKKLLEIGKKYNVRKNAEGVFPDSFIVNEQLILNSIHYSRYDSLEFYRFKTNTGETKDFGLHDSESNSTLLEIFEKV